MFVCICHAISDHEINEARQAGVAEEQKVFAHFGVEMKCGRCVKTISELLGGGPYCGQYAQQNSETDGGDCNLDDTSDDVA